MTTKTLKNARYARHEIWPKIEKLVEDLKDYSAMYKSDSSFAMLELALIEARESAELFAIHSAEIERDINEWLDGQGDVGKEDPDTYSDKHGSGFDSPESKL